MDLTLFIRERFLITESVRKPKLLDKFGLENFLFSIEPYSILNESSWMAEARNSLKFKHFFFILVELL